MMHFSIIICRILSADQMASQQVIQNRRNEMLQTTWNGALVAEANVMLRLQDAVGNGLQPSPTDNSGWLRGAGALSKALNYVRFNIRRCVGTRTDDI